MEGSQGMTTPSITYDCMLGEGDAAGHLPVPCDVRAVFGRARPPVVVAIHGYSYRSTVAIMAREVFVPFRRSHRAAAGVGPGERHTVTLTLDTAPRTVEVPGDLAAALDAAGARAVWDALSFSHQREWAEAVDDAKKPETRARRIAACVAKFGG